MQGMLYVAGTAPTRNGGGREGGREGGGRE